MTGNDDEKGHIVGISKLESSISWLDFSEDDRRKMMEVVSLFKLRETRDELGIGSIRDTFAEMLFLGTGTMQTRARYFLIVPWIYLRLEKRRIPSSKIDERLKQEESYIIRVLLEGDSDGVIGRISGPRLNRFPSNIYWYGLRRWGIFRHNMGQLQYHRSLDRIYQIKQTSHTTDDGEPLDWGSGVNWDPHLPQEPEGFPHGLNLSLTDEEARYLQEKIHLHCSDSMLPFLVDSRVLLDEVDFAWLHPNLSSFPPDLQSKLNHAQNFSEIMFGAALLYNYLLAEKDKREELVSKYKEDLDAWYEIVSLNQRALNDWDLAAFWSLVRAHGRIPIQTQQFVTRWINVSYKGGTIARVEKNKKAREVIRIRETYLKGGRSRFKSKRHRELWGGASGNFQVDYRWWVTKRIVNDIIRGLEKD